MWDFNPAEPHVLGAGDWAWSSSQMNQRGILAGELANCYPGRKAAGGGWNSNQEKLSGSVITMLRFQLLKPQLLKSQRQQHKGEAHKQQGHQEQKPKQQKQKHQKK